MRLLAVFAAIVACGWPSTGWVNPARGAASSARVAGRKAIAASMALAGKAATPSYGTHGGFDAARAKRRRDLMLDDEVRRPGRLAHLRLGAPCAPERRPPRHPPSQVLDIVAWDARRYTAVRVALYYAACVVSFGLVYLVSQWPWGKKSAALAMTEPASDGSADIVLVQVRRARPSAPSPPRSTAAPSRHVAILPSTCLQNKDGSLEVCEVEAVAERPIELLHTRAGRQARRAAFRAPGAAEASARMVVYRHTRFIYDAATRRFKQLEPERLVASVSVASLQSTPSVAAPGGGRDGPAPSQATPFSGALSPAEVTARLATTGRNMIDVPVPPWYVLMVREALHPFVVFQVRARARDRVRGWRGASPHPPYRQPWPCCSCGRLVCGCRRSTTRTRRSSSPRRRRPPS